MSGWRSNQQRQSIWIYAAVGLLVLFVVVSVIGGLDLGADDGGPAAAPTQTAPPNTLAISIASSNTKEAWLHQAVDAFNAAARTDANLRVGGKPIFVVINQETIDGRQVDYRSGTMVSDTLAGRIQPTILSPGEESWIVRFEREWGTAKGGDPITEPTPPTLVRTPLVVAMWESRARALGCWPEAGPDCTWTALRALTTDEAGWGSLGHPEWRNFRFGYGYFGESNSGTLAVLSMCLVGLGRSNAITVADVEPTNGCGEFVADVERAKIHSGKSDVWLLDQMTSGGPEYLDAVVTYESNVIARNRAQAGQLREPLVSVYPQDGTIVVGHPFAILDGTPWVTAEQVQAAGIFRDFLLSPAQQQAVLALGLRPADPEQPLGSPIEAGFGANPAVSLVALPVPETLVIDRIGEVWHEVRKHAVIAIVFDKSGSMSGPKITAAVKGAQAFVNKMEPQDELLWIPFDDLVYPGADGLKSEVGEQLVAEIGGTSAAGGTALYDAVKHAYDELSRRRAERGDEVRYGIVVLSDGQDENSISSLSQLEAALAPSEGDPSGIQIHTIAIGEDADETVLTKIAVAAHGRFWTAETDTDVVVVYQDIAAYF
jgi:Ca-activated chloride channel family protein